MAKKKDNDSLVTQYINGTAEPEIVPLSPDTKVAPPVSREEGKKRLKEGRRGARRSQQARDLLEGTSQESAVTTSITWARSSQPLSIEEIHPRPTPHGSSDELFQTIYDQCGYINWRADEIKRAQVEIQLAAEQLQAMGTGGQPPVDQPPVEPPPNMPPPLEEPPPGSQLNGTLIQPGNMQHIGLFRLPDGGGGTAAYGFDYALTGIAYNPQRNTLFINNHIYEQKTAEIAIPDAGDVYSVPWSWYAQNLYDLMEGNRQNIQQGGGYFWDKCQIGGLLVYGNHIIGSDYAFYDGGKQAYMTHWRSGLTTASQGDFEGLFRVGDPSMQAGFFAGFMCHIPPEWQQLFGGPCLTGQGCLSIISRTSYGPGAFVFDPNQFGGGTTPAQPLIYYDQNHPTLGMWEQQDHVNYVFNMATRVNGIVFPTGSRTVLFFGRQGLGIPCYGDVTTTPGGHCNDPADWDKGCHGWPYKTWVWAYDANELLRVKNGELNPWDVQPYNVWGLDLPVETPKSEVMGVAYDPLTQRIYLAQTDAAYLLPNGQGWDKSPLVHVFQLNNSGGGLLSY